LEEEDKKKNLRTTLMMRQIVRRTWQRILVEKTLKTRLFKQEV